MEEREIQDHDPDYHGNRLQGPPQDVQAKRAGAQKMPLDLNPVAQKEVMLFSAVLRVESSQGHTGNIMARPYSRTFFPNPQIQLLT
jgi:hypothetical protein